MILVTGQRVQAGAQRVGAVPRLIGEVRAGDISDQERVTREQQPGLVATREVIDREGEVLGAVTGCGDGPDPQRAEQDLAAGRDDVRGRRASVGATAARPVAAARRRRPETWSA